MKTERSIAARDLRPGERKSFNRDTGRWYVKRAVDSNPTQLELVRVVYKMDGRGPTDVQLLGSMARIYMQGGSLQDLCKRYKYWDRNALRRRVRILTQNLRACGAESPPKLTWKLKQKRTARPHGPHPDLLKVSKRISKLLALHDEVLPEIRAENPGLSDSECRKIATNEAKQRTGGAQTERRARQKQTLTTQPIFEIPSDEPKAPPMELPTPSPPMVEPSATPMTMGPTSIEAPMEPASIEAPMEPASIEAPMEPASIEAPMEVPMMNCSSIYPVLEDF